MINDILCKNIYQYIFNIFDIYVKLKHWYIYDYQYFILGLKP